MPPRARHRLAALLLALVFGVLGARGAEAQCVNGTACNDFSACTINDTCVNNVCVGTAITCAEDGDVCTTAACNPTLGCQQIANTASCDDGNPCTVGDACSTFVCRSGAPKNCNDGNACTTDQCNVSTGACFSTNNTASCSDGNACTTGDFCSGGSCQPGPTPLVCNDGKTCTTDSCNPGSGCAFTNVANGTGCNDNSLCTTSDRCTNGLCVGTTVTCSDDTNVCTTAACNPALGCQQVPNTAACDDTNPCTVGDLCSGGACLGGGPKNCSDGNDCTTDLCERDGSCTHANNTSSCNDGNACTQNDVCAGGVCQSGVNLTCDPGNGPCQVGSCDAVLGCVLANAPPGTGCNDGNACTTADACSNGACIGSAIPGCVPAPVPTLSFWSRVGLVVALAFTALMASAHWERRRPAS